MTIEFFNRPRTLRAQLVLRDHRRGRRIRKPVAVGDDTLSTLQRRRRLDVLEVDALRRDVLEKLGIGQQSTDCWRQKVAEPAPTADIEPGDATAQRVYPR